MTPHTAFGIRLLDGLRKYPCKDDGAIASRKEPLTCMHDLRLYRGLAHAVAFCHGQKSDFGARATKKLDLRGRGLVREAALEGAG